MDRIYKIISILVISFGLSYISYKIESSFVDKFAENTLALLTTLFAINIASSTLIAGKVREIQDKTGLNFKKTKTELRRSFYTQITLIIIAVIFGILRESKESLFLFDLNELKLFCDTILFFCFICYVDIIKDIGLGLFDLLDFDNNETK